MDKEEIKEALEKKYNPEKEIEKLCDENKIFLTDPREHDKLKSVGFLPLVLNEIQKFLKEEKKNGGYILYVNDPDNKEIKYGFRITYKGGKDVEKEVLEDFGEDNLDFVNPNNSGKFVVDIDLFVNHLLDKYTFKTIFGAKNETVYVYEDGIYTPRGKEIIKTFSEEKLGEHCKNNIVNEILEKIKRKTAIDSEEFEKIPLNLIPLENGVYDIKTNKREDYRHELFFKFKLPVKHDNSAGCPKFLSFINDILYEPDVNLIQEWFGFCLYRKYLFKKGMIWFGETDTGKTTLLNILEGLLGENNCSGLSLHEISNNDRFGLKSLHNKHLNSYDDLSASDIGDSGGFKIATGGGRITAEYKFGDMFKFLNHSKLLFACNEIPSPKNINDTAYFSRWFPVRFDNQIPQEEQNPTFAEDCLKEESSGILEWALIGLKRLLDNKRFSFNKTPSEVKAIMCRSGNPLYAFVSDECKEQEGVWISKQDLYDKYCEYIRKEKLPILTKDKFCKNLPRCCDYLIDCRKDNKRGWSNVRVGGYAYEKLE